MNSDEKDEFGHELNKAYMYHHYQALYKYVQQLNIIKLKRSILNLLRTGNHQASVQQFLPTCGITLGEFMFMTLPHLDGKVSSKETRSKEESDEE